MKIDGAAASIGQELAPRPSSRPGRLRCDIVFNDKNALRVSQNAVASLDFSGVIKEVSLKKGGLTSVLRKLARRSPTDCFRVETATAVAGRPRHLLLRMGRREIHLRLRLQRQREDHRRARAATSRSSSAAHHVARNYVKRARPSASRPPASSTTATRASSPWPPG